jgi:predicted amidohydrolase YtcJ
MALANSLALDRAGITRDTPDPVGGLIVRDPASGQPTGILKDAALALVQRVIPTPSQSEKLTAARAATDHAVALGVTSVQDMSANDDTGVYQELARRGTLKTRIYAFFPLPAWEKPAALGFRAPLGDPWLRIGGLKGFADGSLGSTTALFFEPYLDAPATCGLASDELSSPATLLDRILGADTRGLQIAIHAIGDRANHEILAAFEQLAATRGPRDRRCRIEHAQHLRPQDVPRFAAAHVVASVQPYHAADDGRWADKRIGPTRCQTTYPFRSLLDSGATLAFGSDWTVAPLNPLVGIAAAVTRQTLDGRHPEGWIPNQKISIAEAVHAYTVGSAFAEFQEHLKGTLTPGKLADLVLLDRDIFAVPPPDIANARVVLTVLDGRVVYELP